MRIPNSGGALIDGKAFADAIRANPGNPAADGRHYPVAGAAEWHHGAAAMANDPRDHKLNNARINFVKPQCGNKALRDLARWLYRQLQAEYDHLTSDEAIEEGIIVNEYTFTEEGRRFG